MATQSERDRHRWKHYYGRAAWKHRRELQLQAEPLCARRARLGRTVPAVVADHIDPHNGEWMSA
jgi:hypothetical protein